MGLEFQQGSKELYDKYGMDGKASHLMLSRNGEIVERHRSLTQLPFSGGYALLNQYVILSPHSVCFSFVFSCSLHALDYFSEDPRAMHSNELPRSPLTLFTNTHSCKLWIHIALEYLQWLRSLLFLRWGWDSFRTALIRVAEPRRDCTFHVIIILWSINENGDNNVRPN